MSADMEMSGKVCLVTGATSGIGEVAARELARRGATVAMVARDPDKGARVRDAIIGQTGNEQVTLLQADLASLAQVRALAAAFLERFDRLDVLLNNAGVYRHRYSETEDGYETTFAVNHLAPFLLTDLLAETLKASAPARVINVSSGAHSGGHLDFDDLHGRGKWGGFRAYGQSKLANILFTRELARRLAGSGVTVNALHPGFVRSGFAMDSTGGMKLAMVLARIFARSPEKGAETSVYLATSGEVEGVTGEYFADRAIAKTSAEARDPEVAARLWKISEELVAV